MSNLPSLCLRRACCAIVLFLLASFGRVDVHAEHVAPARKPDGKMLFAYLQSEAAKHFDARRKVVANLKSPEDVRKRQEFLKARFVRALDGFPERLPDLAAWFAPRPLTIRESVDPVGKPKAESGKQERK